MRRPINWITVSISLLFLLVGLTVSGCGGGGSGDDAVREGPPQPVSGMLRKARSAAELEASLKGSMQAAVNAGALANGAPGADVTTGGFSGTYTVEAGVDEFDNVRYDGTHLYVAPTGYMQDVPPAVRILRTDALAGSAAEVAKIALDPQESVLGLYAANQRLVVLSSRQLWGIPSFGDVWIAIAIWAPTELTLRVFDTTDAARPQEIFAAEIDGVFIESRRIEDRVVLISRHAPRLLVDPEQRVRLALASLDELLPRVTYDGRTQPLVRPDDCYVANDEVRRGHAVLTTISVFSLQNPRDFASICYDQPANGVYASQTALYLSEPRYSATSPITTRIHKFSLTPRVPEYVGSVEVPGDVWTRGQNDFRMNEHQGQLRVFTTEQTSDAADFEDHRLFVLREKPAARELEIVARLPNERRNDEIGKPNERLYGVRFAGDRAYAVTFRRVDPLYVFDLSNAADPRVAGELLIPGLSDFLHPVNEGLLLGLGRVNNHFKVELFDVSVMSSPQSRGAVTLEGFTSYSEAEYDRHAFAWLPGNPDRFAVPASVTEAGTYWRDSALYQYEIAGKDLPATATLRSAGFVRPPAANDYERAARTPSRSFIDGNTVFYVRDGNVYVTRWANPGEIRGPY